MPVEQFMREYYRHTSNVRYSSAHFVATAKMRKGLPLLLNAGATQEEMREAVKASVPPGTEELNLKAFDAGWDYFQQEYGEGKVPEAASEAVAS